MATFIVDLLYHPIRISIGNFLGIPIVDNPLIFLSLWSIVHVIVAFLIMSFLVIKTKIKTYWKFICLFALLFIYEIVEYQLYMKWATTLFIPETPVDLIWDLIVGMLSGLITYIIIKCWSK